MEKLPLISLDRDWQCAYFEREPNVRELASPGTPVPSLPDWSCSRRYGSPWAAYLQHTFHLEPTDECVSYILHIESAPGTVVLYVNGRRLGEFDGSLPFSFDITDYVALEDNSMALRVECAESGRFGKLHLQPLPCE
ncbi:hypothetical protein BAC2_01259 [uncultured bacterium]|nr:hypothetical protein BAC2_01259 [uncultured bacterium]